MGMLVDGKWERKPLVETSESGGFERAPSVLRNWVTSDGAAGPDGGGRVHCLTCHRAHASSAPQAGRWDFAVEFLIDDGVSSGSHALPSPYPALEQDSLCNKCHSGESHDFDGGDPGIVDQPGG